MISALTPESLVDRERPELEARKAQMRDIVPILRLINGYAAQGIMLPRTEFELSEHLRDFSVIYAGEKLAACGSLHFYTPTMGEIRSLAVEPSLKTHGIGRTLIEILLEEAGNYSLGAVFAFTYVPDFFRKMGFSEVERGELPLKAWKDCLRCPKFQCCDEIAMVRILRPEHWVETHAAVQSFSDTSVLLPIVAGQK